MARDALPRRRRLARAAGATAAGAAALLLALGLYLRRDVTAVFATVGGEYAAARTLEDWRLGDDRCRLVQLRNHRGEVVTTAYVRTPPRTPAQPRVLLTYAGQKTGRKMLELIPRRPDLVLVAVQYPYERPRRPAAYLRWPYDVRRAVFRTVAGGMHAVTFLEREEKIASDRLLVLGASLGTSFAVMHGALDPRVGRVLVVHGGGDLTAVVWASERQAGHALRAPLTTALAALLVDSFDPVRWAGRIAPRPLTVLASRRDRHFPAASARALYDSAGEPRQLLWTETEHVGAGKTEIVAQLVQVVEAHLAADAEAGPPGDGGPAR